MAGRFFFGEVLGGGLVAGIVVVKDALGSGGGGFGPSPGSGGLVARTAAPVPDGSGGLFKKLVDFGKSKLGKVTKIGIVTFILEKVAKSVIEKGHFNDPTQNPRNRPPAYDPTDKLSDQAAYQLRKSLPQGRARTSTIVTPMWLRDP